MVILEAALLKVGTTVSTSLLRSYLGAGTIKDPHADLATIVNGQLSNLFERRKATRMFEDLADTIAEKLDPFLQVEMPNLSDNDKAAAIDAVSDVLHSVDLGDHLIITNDVNPVTLERAIRAGVGDVATERLFSGEGRQLYDLILSQACSYLVELRMVLPSFGSNALVELLSRSSNIQNLLTEILRRIPEPPDFNMGGNPDALFEHKYRLQVARGFDRLDLFGVRTDVPRYKLSVAYITLSAQQIGRRAMEDEPGGQTGRSKRSGDGEHVATASVAGSSDDELQSFRIDDLLPNFKPDVHTGRGRIRQDNSALLACRAVRTECLFRFPRILESVHPILHSATKLRRVSASQTLRIHISVCQRPVRSDAGTLGPSSTRCRKGVTPCRWRRRTSRRTKGVSS